MNFVIILQELVIICITRSPLTPVFCELLSLRFCIKMVGMRVNDRNESNQQLPPVKKMMIFDFDNDIDMKSAERRQTIISTK